MIELSIALEGAEPVILELAGLDSALHDFAPLFKEIADDFEQRKMPQVFAQQGPGWPALAASTVRYKERHFPGTTILRRTDRLYDSLTGGADGVREISSNQMILGTNVEYGRFHQSPEPRTKLPRRAFLEITEEDKQIWDEKAQSFVAFLLAKG